MKRRLLAYARRAAPRRRCVGRCLRHGYNGGLSRLGWQVVAPEGSGTFRSASIQKINALDPDAIILANPGLALPAWSLLRTVRYGHAYIAKPAVRVDDPPSTACCVWLRGGDPVSLASLFNASVYDRVLTADQAIAGVTASAKP